MKKIAFGIFLCTFFLMRPYVMQQNGLWYSDDDRDYFAHASAICFGQFPSYKNEHFTILKEGPQSSVGPGILASPFVFIFSLLDRVAGSDIVAQRTAENIEGSWSQFGFVFASGFYFALGCFLLYSALKLFVEKRYAALSVILCCLVQGIPLYAFRRPIFSQLYEFAVQAIMVSFFLIIKHKGGFPQKNMKLVFLLGLGAGLTFLTRYNNFFMGAAWPLLFLINEKSDFRKPVVLRNLLASYVVFALLVMVFKIWPGIYNNCKPYSWAGEYLLKMFPLSFYLKRVWHILFFPDWGLLYTAPFVILGLAAVCFHSFPKKKAVLLSLAPLLVNLYIAVVWRSQAAWYGYRFLIPALIPSLVLPLAFLLKSTEEKAGRPLSFIWALIAFVPAICMLAFEGNYADLDVAVVEQYFGYTDYGNNLYVMSVFKMFLFRPFEFLAVVFKGGGLYLQYLFALGMKACGLWPSAYFTEYPEFKPVILIKTFLLYGLPFFLGAVLRKRKET